MEVHNKETLGNTLSPGLEHKVKELVRTMTSHVRFGSFVRGNPEESPEDTAHRLVTNAATARAILEHPMFEEFLTGGRELLIAQLEGRIYNGQKPLPIPANLHSYIAIHTQFANLHDLRTYFQQFVTDYEDYLRDQILAQEEEAAAGPSGTPIEDPSWAYRPEPMDAE